MPPTAAQLRDYARRRAAELGANPDEIVAIGNRESAGFNPNIPDSPAGAMGPMQLMPGTARDLGVNPRDPFQNIDGGIRYYMQQRQRFGNPVLAAAAYNAGPEAVARYGGVPPYRETRGYVQGFPGGQQAPQRGGGDIFGLEPAGGSNVPQQTGSGADIFGLDQQQPQRQRTPPPPAARSAPPPNSAAAQAQAAQAFLAQQNAIFARAGAQRPGIVRSEGTMPAQQATVGGNANPGLARSYGQGLQDSVLSMGDRITVPGMIRSGVNDLSTYGGWAARHLGVSGRTVDRARAGIANSAPMQLLNAVAPDPTAIGRAALLNTTPQTPGERLAYLGGAATPALAAPASLPTRLLGIGGGVLGAWGAGEVGRNAGWRPDDIQVAQTAGGVLGGLVGTAASGIRVGPPRVAAPTGISEAMPVSPNEALRAARYTVNQINPEAIPPNAEDLQAQGATSAEMMGPRGQTALGALARRQGATGPALAAQVAERVLGRPDRIQSDVGTATGINPGEAQSTIENIIQAGRNNVRPMFERATASDAPVTSPRLTQLSETPVVQQALQQVYADMANNVDGPPTGALVRQTPEGRYVFEPTAAVWDRVYQAVSRLPERNQFTGRIIPDSESPGNFNINRVRANLRAELGAQLPEWDAAMTAAGEYTPLSSAYRDGGRMLFDNRVTERQFGQRVEGMSPPELEAMRAGIANQVFDMVRSGRLRLAAFRVPRIQSKLVAALGEERAGSLMRSLGSESAMQAFEQRYGTGAGSITSEINMAQAEQNGGAPSAGSALVQGATDLMTRGPRATAMGWVARQGQSIADRMRTSGLNQGALDEAGRLLMSNMTPQQLMEYLWQIQQQRRDSRTPSVGYEMPRIPVIPPPPPRQRQPAPAPRR